MPSKFITASIWKEIEHLTVEKVIEFHSPIKDTEMLNYVLIKGLANITSADIKAVRLLKEGEAEMNLDMDSITKKHVKKAS